MRFPEFTEEWKEERLNEIAELSKGVGISKEQLSEEGEPCILYGELYTKYKFEIIRKVISKTNIESSNLKRSKRNDVIIPCSGETAIDIAVARCIPFDNILLGGDLNIIRLHKNKHVERLLQTYLQGGQGNLSADIVKNIPFYFANSEEQDKLAKFISLLDKRIATQNKIIEKLETLIKGITDVLLDNPLWEKVFLHSFMQFYPSNSLSWEQLSYEDGKIRNLHYGLIHNFSTKGITANSLPMILPHNEPKQFTLCKVGDVAFADASEDTNEIGKAVEFISVHPSGTVCGLHTIHGRDIKNKTFVGFKGFAFNSRYFHDQIKRLAQGSKVFSITASNLLSCYIYIPNIAKQEMITKLLHAYEEKIMANKTLLDKYEMQRAYLLQRMFI